MSNKASKGQWDSVAIATAVLLAFSFAFGGASRENTLRLAVVELAALPLLVVGASRLIRNGDWRLHRFSLSLLACTILLPLLQLVPLPPSIWTSLPGRSDMALALQLAGIQPGWAPLTVTPDLTWGSVLALLPPVAVFIAALTTPLFQTTRTIWLWLAFAVVSVMLGAAQLATGERLYPWAVTAAGSVNGFFANRNHLADLLLAATPFAAVLGAAVLRRRSEHRFPLWFGALFVGIVVVGLAAIRSRAGVILFGPVMVLSLLAAWIAAGRGRPKVALIGMAGAVVVAVGAVALFALPPILARFDVQSVPEGRFEGWPIVSAAADAWLPFGSGFGSFDAVFRSVEPLDQLTPTFFNHAHNDYLETWLEAGWLGAALIIGLLVWFVRRSWAAWRAGVSREADLLRAASIAILAMLVHSTVDYPLRTATLAMLFALCAAILDGAGKPAPPRTASVA